MLKLLLTSTYATTCNICIAINVFVLRRPTSAFTWYFGGGASTFLWVGFYVLGCNFLIFTIFFIFFWQKKKVFITLGTKSWKQLGSCIANRSLPSDSQQSVCQIHTHSAAATGAVCKTPHCQAHTTYGPGNERAKHHLLRGVC